MTQICFFLGQIAFFVVFGIHYIQDTVHHFLQSSNPMSGHCGYSLAKSFTICPKASNYIKWGG
jgi:hypothetical protein